MQQANAAKPTSFMPHVNGMRALAILGVLFYHLNAEYCPAGYFGVDAFLVISGYFLLASLLKAERPADLRYGSYLLKKSWRIIPSWFVVSLVFCLGSGAFMLDSDRVVICNTACRSGFFGADFYIDRLYDYFNQNAHNNLFLHFWYLSITCQMYIILPLIVMLVLWRGSKKAAAVVLGVIGLLSLALYFLTTTPSVPEALRLGLLKGTGMKTSYYHLLPRLWEIMAGGAVLLLPAWQGKRRLRVLLESLGALGVVASYYLFETGSPQVYMAVISTVLFIRYGGEGPLSRLLGCKPIQWIGTISFSLYLWHWPIMAGWKYIRLDGVFWYDELGMMLLSVLLGWLAWRWVESLRMPKQASRMAVCMRFLPLALLILFVSAIRPYYKRIHDSGLDSLEGIGLLREVISELVHAPKDEALLRGYNKEVFELPPAYLGQDKSVQPCFMLMGDSHSTHCVLGLERYCTERGLRGIFLNNHVSPLWYCYKDDHANWTEARAEAVMEYLRQHPSIKYVFLATLWHNRLYGTPKDNGGVTMDWREMRSLNQQEMDELREKGLRETCRRLSDMGIRVILLSDIPFILDRLSPYEMWYKAKFLTGKDVPEYLIPVRQHQERDKRCIELFRKLVNEGVAWMMIDCAEALRQGDNYRTRNDNNEFLYYDSNHLTRVGSFIVGKHIMDEWQAKMQTEAPAPPAETESSRQNTP